MSGKNNTCPFCINDDKKILETKNAFVISDKYPVTKYHSLIIPKRHVKSFFDLTPEEIADCMVLIKTSKKTLCELDKTISGFNIGVNDGVDAGQTISHCHIHLIPRRKREDEEDEWEILYDEDYPFTESGW